jgi:hypothetical protein
MRIDCKLGSHTRRGGCKDRAVAPDLGLSLLARGRWTQHEFLEAKNEEIFALWYWLYIIDIHMIDTDIDNIDVDLSGQI